MARSPIPHLRAAHPIEIPLSLLFVLLHRKSAHRIALQSTPFPRSMCELLCVCSKLRGVGRRRERAKRSGGVNFSASSASSARAAPPRPPRPLSIPLTLYSARLAHEGHSELRMTANAATLGGSADQAKAVKPVPLEQFDSVFGSLIGAST